MFGGVFMPPAADQPRLPVHALQAVDFDQKGQMSLQAVYHMTSPPFGEMLWPTKKAAASDAR